MKTKPRFLWIVMAILPLVILACSSDESPVITGVQGVEETPGVMAARTGSNYIVNEQWGEDGVLEVRITHPGSEPANYAVWNIEEHDNVHARIFFQAEGLANAIAESGYEHDPDLFEGTVWTTDRKYWSGGLALLRRLYVSGVAVNKKGKNLTGTVTIGSGDKAITVNVQPMCLRWVILPT